MHGNTKLIAYDVAMDTSPNKLSFVWRLSVKVGDLVQDIHSVVTGIIIHDARLPHWHVEADPTCQKKLHFCVKWLYADGAKTVSKNSWRTKKELILLSRSP